MQALVLQATSDRVIHSPRVGVECRDQDGWTHSSQDFNLCQQTLYWTCQLDMSTTLSHTRSRGYGSVRLPAHLVTTIGRFKSCVIAHAVCFVRD